MRSALKKKKIRHTEWFLENHPDKAKVVERVLFFNPKKLYKRIENKIDPYKRHQGLQMDDVFPKIEGKCACGCDKVPESSKEGAEYVWQRKWAHWNCQSFASDVLSIINNYFGKPAYYIKIYAGNKCSECDETHDLELDHIIGVKHGGGGCWLSNYRFLCRKHHVKKTNKTFGKGEFKIDTSGQIKMELSVARVESVENKQQV